MNERDPRLQPRAGDMLSRDGVDVRVDFVEPDGVFCVRWIGEQAEGRRIHVTATEWRAQAPTSLVIAEGVPGIAVAWAWPETSESR